MKNREKVVTRIAPSPTGTLHVGTARSALFNYLFAKGHDGTFIVRIEDTDKERSKKEFETNILEGLKSLGLSEDALYRQGERKEIYSTHITTLIESGAAYVSKEESKAKPGEFVEVVRLKNKGKDITFTDQIRGEITFNTKELGDFVIARTIKEPLYHLAVVIDDNDMGITHIIRGEDHISNTPRQILIQEAFGFGRPIYAHMPLILGADRSKLSKRHGAVSISKYLENYTAEALINYLALLGWNPGTEQEFFTLDDLVKQFDISKIQKSGAMFSTEKLDSINHHYLKEMPEDKYRAIVTKMLPKSILKGKLYTNETPSILSGVLQERAKNYFEMREILESGELDFYTSAVKLEMSKISWKDTTTSLTKEYLSSVHSVFELIDSTLFTAEATKDAIWEYATEKGRGAVLWPLRYALSGKEKSPDPFSIASAIGKEEALNRIQKAIDALK